MTNKLVVIINRLKVKKKIKEILLYEMKFLVPNYSCLQNPWLGSYRTQISILAVLCSQLNLLNPPQKKKKSWVCHWLSLLEWVTAFTLIQFNAQVHSRLSFVLYQISNPSWNVCAVQQKKTDLKIISMGCTSVSFYTSPSHPQRNVTTMQN